MCVSYHYYTVNRVLIVFLGLMVVVVVADISKNDDFKIVFANVELRIRFYTDAFVWLVLVLG